MNRTTAATLIAAGVVGLAGGTVVAVVRDGDPAPGRTPSAGGAETPTPRPSTSPSTARPARAELLYAASGRIVDGSRTITWKAPALRTTELVRAGDGYLVGFDPNAEGLPGDQTSTELWSVRPDGEASRVATVRGRWDLDRAGEQVVGTDHRSGKVTAWSVGDAGSSTWRTFRGGVSPVWVGDQVMVSAPQSQGGQTLVSWDPETGAESSEDLAGFGELTATVAGDLIGGQVGRDGLPDSEEAFCLASSKVGDTSGAGQWRTCDWRSNTPALQYSPDGSRVLAIPADTDGFGPGVFGVFSALRGPSAGVTEIDVPDATLGAEWLGTDRLVVYGASDLDLDEQTRRVLSVCDLEGECTEAVRGEPGEDLVVATTR